MMNFTIHGKTTRRGGYAEAESTIILSQGTGGGDSVALYGVSAPKGSVVKERQRVFVRAFE